MSLLIRPNIFFFSTHFRETHRLVHKKSDSFVYKLFCLLTDFLNKYPHKAGNWHALIHEQYFSKDSFLDICQCAFNIITKFLLLRMKYIIDEGCLHHY